jgi:protein-disulfide isomerase
MLKPLLDATRDHIFGWLFAPIELVQYGDLQCPHCAAVYPDIKQLQEVMGNQLKYAFRHYPLPQFHALALDAAIACEMAALQDKFWYMHDLIFENQPYLSRAALLRFADEIEMDTTLLTDTREHKKMSRKVIGDFESGVRSGVNGTPTFFINGLRYNGMNDLEGLLTACKYTQLMLEAELKQPEPN